MIIECTNEKIDSVFEYIGQDYGKCLYIYIDLKKFGLDDENFNVWIQYNDNDETCAVISEYYGGIQVYSKSNDLNPKEIADFINDKNAHVVFAMKPVIDKLHNFLPEYDQETGFVGELTDLKYPQDSNAYPIGIDELAEVVEIIAEDELIGKPYGYESLYAQYCERQRENFGRNFILRDSNNNALICHAGTYAELPELAVVGGVLTTEDYRRKGYSKKVLSTLCHQLKSENKRIFSFYYILPAKKMHNRIGFEEIGEWSKLIKNE